MSKIFIADSTSIAMSLLELKEEGENGNSGQNKNEFVHIDRMISFHLSLSPNPHTDLSHEAQKGHDLHNGGNCCITQSTVKLLLI